MTRKVTHAGKTAICVSHEVFDFGIKKERIRIELFGENSTDSLTKNKMEPISNNETKYAPPLIILKALR